MQSTYAKFFNRSHDAVIRVYDEAGDVIENARAHGRFQRVVNLVRITPHLRELSHELAANVQNTSD